MSSIRLAASGALVCLALTACHDDELVFIDDESAGAAIAAEPTAETGPAPRIDDPSTPADNAHGDLTPLETLEDPATTLAAADVREPGGAVIGVVSAVQAAPDGALEHIVVVLDEGRTLTLAPSEARYRIADGSLVLIKPAALLKS
jgi:hypothetical protein